MKQVQFSETGDAGVARVVAVARPDVRVESASVSFADIVRRRGDPYPVPTPLPAVPGSEVAGFVEAVGEDVKDDGRRHRIRRHRLGSQYVVTETKKCAPAFSGGRWWR